MFEQPCTTAKDDEELSEGRIRCSACGQHLADIADVLSTAGGGLFINPVGVAFQIIRTSHAQNVEMVSEPTLEATWFSGYAWAVLVCSRCRRHVGWRYHSTHGDIPRLFFGLAKGAITFD